MDYFFRASHILAVPGDIVSFDSVGKPSDARRVATNVQGGSAGIIFEGVVKWFNKDLGYGFIHFDGRAVYVHANDVSRGRLYPGMDLHVDLL